MWQCGAHPSRPLFRGPLGAALFIMRFFWAYYIPLPLHSFKPFYSNFAYG